MTLDDRQREEEHANYCWDGCDDLHTCPDCGKRESVCQGDCDQRFGGDSPSATEVVTEYGFEDGGPL